MIYFQKQDNLHIRIDTNNKEYLKDIRNFLAFYKKGFRFMPRYRAGAWDGKIQLFNSAYRTFPYGLMVDVLKHTKKEWPEEEYQISRKVKELFNGGNFEVNWDLKWPPRPYQEDCVNTALKFPRGLFRVATAGGKSYIITAIIKTLLENGIGPHIIIVPTKGLVTQFYEDLAEYGIDKTHIGRVFDKYREFDKNIVVSTWQSLQNRKQKLQAYQGVFLDETHGARADQIRDVVRSAINARWRQGFTGTLPSDLLEKMQVRSYLGTVLREYSSSYLAKEGYIAECKVKSVHIDYKDKISGDYNEIKEQVFQNPYRLGVLQRIVNDVDCSSLLLVDKVEKEGEFLQQYFERCGDMKDKEIMFLSGRDDAEEREKWRRYMDTKNKVVLIATYGIFSTGINIPSLRNLILASPSKSKIRVLQSIGRSLRAHANKKDGAIIWDIYDNTKYLKKHGNTRLKYYAKEQFEVEEFFLEEGAQIEL